MRTIDQKDWVKLGNLVLIYCPKCGGKIRLNEQDVGDLGIPQKSVRCGDNICDFRDYITLERWLTLKKDQ